MYREQVAQLAENPKAQAVGATFTTTSGMLTVLELLPAILGIPATMMGMVLTWYMISKVKMDRKKSKLEIELMKKEHVCETCADNRRAHES